jgi:glutamate--cysteine ligase catalytic subunit
MVNITDGQVLYWPEINSNLAKIQSIQVEQFIRIYNRFKDIKDDPFKWGDEIELSLIKFDHANKKCYLLLKSDEFFEHIEKIKHENVEQNNEIEQCEFHNEYTKYIIETVPASPFDHDHSAFGKLEQNISLRKRIIQKFLSEDEYVISLTSFPRLGCTNFTWPNELPLQPLGSREHYNSLFYSNKIIMNRELMLAATYNKIDRRESLPAIYVPIFKDKHTPKPFIDGDIPKELVKPDHIYMVNFIDELV